MDGLMPAKALHSTALLRTSSELLCSKLIQGPPDDYASLLNLKRHTCQMFKYINNCFTLIHPFFTRNHFVQKFITSKIIPLIEIILYFSHLKLIINLSIQFKQIVDNYLLNVPLIFE